MAWKGALMAWLRRLWLHRPSGTVCEYVGEDRDAHGNPYALMEMSDGTRARIDPLALFAIDGEWEKIAESDQPAGDAGEHGRAH
jgi:hypothetical protein